MIKCENCSKPAEYKTDEPSARPQNFCKGCLPWHLANRARLGFLINPNAAEIVEPPAVEEPVVEEAPKPKSKKKPVVEEPVVEEAPVEEAPVEDVPQD